MMENLLAYLIFCTVLFILFATLRAVLLLFWRVQEKRKTLLWSYIDFQRFYIKFKLRWIIFGNRALPEQNARILLWNFSDPKGPSYNHRFSKKAASVVRKYLEYFYT